MRLSSKLIIDAVVGRLLIFGLLGLHRFRGGDKRISDPKIPPATIVVVKLLGLGSIIQATPMLQALQLRYLETLTVIAADKNSTIVFPLPLDIVGPLLDALKARPGSSGTLR